MRSPRQLIGSIIFWIIYPGLYLRISNSQRVRVIIKVGDRVLFVTKWLSNGQQSLPGGGVQSGESPLKAAIREVREEVGIDLLPENLKIVVEGLGVKETGIKYSVNCYEI